MINREEVLTGLKNDEKWQKYSSTGWEFDAWNMI